MKLYFKTAKSETCSDLEVIKDEMRCNNETEATIHPAVKDSVDGFFWCHALGEIGEKGQCGKQCSDYKPRNSKSGCCVSRGDLYRPSIETITVKLNHKQ